MDDTIICCNRELSLVGPPVIKWTDPNGFNAYNEDEYEEFEEDRKTGEIKKKVVRGKRYKMRNISDGNWESLSNYINKFVIHHSVTYRSEDTFNALNRRGLSSVFLIDDDMKKINGVEFATIHQTMDMRDIGYTQGSVNETSVGVEISYMPQYWDNPSLYSESNKKRHKVQDHPIKTDYVRGHKFRCFAPTQAQINSLIHLAHGIIHILPNMPRKFPKENGKYFRGTLDNPNAHAGLVTHYHVSSYKIDALGLPFKEIEQGVEKLWNT